MLTKKQICNIFLSFLL